MKKIISLFFVFFALISCGKKDEASDGKIKVVWWVEVFDDTTALDVLIAETATYFNENNDKNIYVEAIPQPNHWEAVRTSVAGGGGPDIINTPGPNFAKELAVSGKLLSLNKYSEQYNWQEKVLPWAYELGETDGDLYYLPADMEGILLFYNKTILEEYGLNTPTNMYDFMKIMGEAKAKGLIPNSAGNAEWRAENEHFVGEFFNAIVGPQKIYKTLKGEGKFTDKEFVEAINVLNEAMTNGYWSGSLENYYTTSTSDKYIIFAGGEAAFHLTGSWVFGKLDRYFDETGSEWDWMPTPSNFPTFFSVGSGSTYAINANSEVADAAAEFINYMFSPETQERIISKAEAVPFPIKMDVDKMTSIKDPRYRNYLNSLLEATAEGNMAYLLWIHYPPKTQTYLWEAIEKVWAGTLTAEQYLANAQVIFDEELAKGLVPPVPKPAGL